MGASEISEEKEQSNFILSRIKADIEQGKNAGRVATRFPPEPNGYLHIGHAKSICLNFGIADTFSAGTCNLRFDDTNPIKEEQEYVESIIADVTWLGFQWTRLCYASDYFQQLYDWAVDLIKNGKAYVCDLSAEETRSHRGTLTEPGVNSPYRERSVEENLDLFAKMKRGECDEGVHVLRAKIDMASPNMNLRDPVIYRVMKADHHRTGSDWCIYPMYDYAHGLSDAIELITHSICTLEFEDHRPLYDWFIDQIDVPAQPQQIEFARLNLSYTVLSKRKLLTLVKDNHVSGWDDPRMPTIAGMRRRGYTPEALRDFCDRIGVAKAGSIVDLELLHFCLRDDLNRRCARVMAVLDPLKVVITNYPEDQIEEFEAPNAPDRPELGSRSLPFSRELYIERGDFLEDPPRKFFRLAPGKEVRLMHAYYITCNEVVKDPETGEVVELRCTYDPESRGGGTPDGRKVKGTMHWVSAQAALDVEVRLYDNLFVKEDPNEAGEEEDFSDFVNPDSLTIKRCKVELSLRSAPPGERYQFMRQGYFCVDAVDSTADNPVFNRIVGLRDSWAKKR